ncbi:CRISPR-associated endonuclease Cas2 [Clostridium weizhouense]|uniref:CRISPR-associated endoribonuclease Cas2 n=1 Tax=Clostridium weizhouense TaxID=2859781 RepID=A0ABS7ALY0_9CLOT|nr:CRISPR-associated endonuclease Cas2 [Clostridium weizhouense]MBW6409667.1 CRISPR-associated endonuclease Cas2 [Clostridium weizhouense]
MRVIVFFDLPTLTTRDRSEYRKFRKFLINEGFIMMQESIYSKIALNNTTANLIKKKVKKNKVKGGLIQMMVITEKQYAAIEYVSGGNTSKILSDTNRMVIL